VETKVQNKGGGTIKKFKFLPSFREFMQNWKQIPNVDPVKEYVLD
jgi:hypothetical protein